MLRGTIVGESRAQKPLAIRILLNVLKEVKALFPGDLC